MARPNKIQLENRYVTRCEYAGKLIKVERAAKGNMICTFLCRVSTLYFDNVAKVRVFVPHEVEKYLNHKLVIGENYFVLAVPYRVAMRGYRHRVDMMINLFRE